MPVDVTLDAARADRDGALADLLEVLRIPSVSADREACARNAAWVADRCEMLGARTEVVGDGNPVVHAEWIVRTGAPVLTIYGHYDVQPPDPVEAWTTPPFEPDVRDGRVFARGAEDSKGNHIGALRAIGSWMRTGGLPLNVRLLLEGEEEVAGPALPRFLRGASERLRSDLVLLWDGSFTPDDRPALCVGLRGIVNVEIEVRGPSHDLHSGQFGGVVANPANELARILAGLADADGLVRIDGFYDDVLDVDPGERARWHMPDDRLLARAAGVRELAGDTAERLWARPTLDVNGMWSGYTGPGAKTVIPASAHAKVSMRLVPDQDPDAISAAFERHVARDGVTVRLLNTCRPVRMDARHPALDVAAAAFEESFGRRGVLVRSGASIPVADAFADAIGAPMFLSGIGHVDANAHAPDENLRLDHFHRGIEMLIRFMHRLGAAWG